MFLIPKVSKFAHLDRYLGGMIRYINLITSREIASIKSSHKKLISPTKIKELPCPMINLVFDINLSSAS